MYYGSQSSIASGVVGPLACGVSAQPLIQIMTQVTIYIRRWLYNYMSLALFLAPLACTIIRSPSVSKTRSEDG